MTLQESLEFLVVDHVQVRSATECCGKRWILIRGCQPAVEEISDFDRLEYVSNTESTKRPGLVFVYHPSP